MKDNQNVINLLKTGDLSAESMLVHKFNSRLFTYFRSRIKGEDNYEDLVQEVFVSFFIAVKKDKIQRDEFIAPFIFGIAKRVVYNYFYKKKKGENIKKKAENEHNPFIDFSGEQDLWNERMIKIISDHIKNLKDIDKVILKEYFFNDNTIGEISVLINRSKHYVSVRKERAIKKIKSEMMSAKDLYK
ncbi:MAG: sigma-70 family RNA polymerase sigma factor [Acidobacteriota bacterium]